MEEHTGHPLHLGRDCLARAGLPHPPIRRWSPQLKLRIIGAVGRGVIALEEICRHYEISLPEFEEWHSALQMHGMRGLRARRARSFARSVQSED